MAYLGEEASFLGRISDACPGQLLPLSCDLTANLPPLPPRTMEQSALFSG